MLITRHLCPCGGRCGWERDYLEVIITDVVFSGSLAGDQGLPPAFVVSVPRGFDIGVLEGLGLKCRGVIALWQLRCNIAHLPYIKALHIQASRFAHTNTISRDTICCGAS